MSIDALSWANDYTGKDDAKAYIDDRITIANAQIEAARDTLDTIIAALSDATVDTSLDDIPEFNVEKPDIDTSGLDALEAPESPFDLDAVTATPELDELEVEEWDIGDVGDIPDTPTLETLDPNPLSSISKPSSSIIGAPPSTDDPFIPEVFDGGFGDYLESVAQTLIGLGENAPTIDIDNHVDLMGNVDDVVIVDPAMEQAIYDRARRRLREEEATQVEQVEASFQARGFSYPPGALAAAISRARTAVDNSLTDISKDIITEAVKLEQIRTELGLKRAAQITAAQEAHDKITVSIEALNAEYYKAHASAQAQYLDASSRILEVQANVHAAMERLKLEAKNSNLEAAIKVYNAKVDTFKSLMEAYGIEANVLVSDMRARVEYNDGLVKIFTGQLEGIKTRIELERSKIEGTKTNAEIANMKIMADIEAIKTENERLTAIARIFASEVEAYKSSADALTKIETLKLQKYDVETRGEAAKVDAAVKVAVAEVEEAIKAAALNIETLKSQATLATSIISSALNSMNTSASFGFKGSLARSVDYRGSKHIQYGYSYSGSTETIGNPHESNP